MPRVPPQDRLQPSLLDRLTDENPSQKSEAPENRVLSMEELRRHVIRDLTWLYNTGDLDAIEDLEDYPLVAESTLNYGIAHLAGTPKSGIDAHDIERQLRRALIRFEPRILRDTVKVEVLTGEQSPSHNAITCYIEGMLWADPVPLHIFLKTEADLEVGNFTVTEQAGREET